MSPLLAASVIILSACGGGGAPADVTDDADAAVPMDTIGNDTVTPDAVGRDVDDVATVDVAGDAVDFDSTLDVIGDALLDVADDAVPDVQGDTIPGDVGMDALCVPDCTGGPCTNDGCGGDCCDEPNVCDRNLDGTAMVCLPREGSTCAEIGQCSSACGNFACMSACYDAGSADARDALWAVMDCVIAACPQITEECATGAYAEGGACYTEHSNCLNGCTPDCSGGPCTDDGCGGDCCDAPDACQAPESGVGLECLPAPEKTCRQIWACAIDCDGPECAEACINSGSAEGQAQLNTVLTCLDDVCAGNPTEECVYAAVEPGAECADEFNTCT